VPGGLCSRRLWLAATGGLGKWMERN
jgi:hypothetical protein